MKIAKKCGAAALLFMLATLSSCASSHCTSDDDCEDSFCIGVPGARSCAKPCETGCASGQRCMEVSDGRAFCVSDCSDAACGDEVCGERWNGLPTCAEPCSGGWDVEPGAGCVDGVPLSCETADGRASCDSCPCPAGEVCHWVHEVCAPPSKVGEICLAHSDCESMNCGGVLDLVPMCNRAEGAACDGDNCAACALVGLQTSCLQICEWDGDCPDGSYCYGRAETGYFCREQCNAFSLSGCPDGFDCRYVPRDGYYAFAVCYPEELVDGSANTICKGEPETCSVCDRDPAHDCEDCAGVWAGSAYHDMCGTCDANPNNDCVQDCAGEWGGTRREDRCGTCDYDPTNDCVPASCTSPVAQIGGCWFLGELGESCTEVCASRGGYDPNTYLVAGTSPSTCETLLAALGVEIDYFYPLGTRSGQGCEARFQSSGTVVGMTNIGGENPDMWTTSGRRVCACLE